MSAACEFCNYGVPTVADVEVLFRKLEEVKTERKWTFEDLSSFRKSLHDGIMGIAQTLNDKNVKELRIQTGTYRKPGELIDDLDHRILLPEKRYIKRTTDDPQKEICITCKGHKPFDMFWGP